MNTFGIFLCAALLVGAAIAQNGNEALCGDGCKLLCQTTGSLCVDVYPLINCAASEAACMGSCGQTCSCNAKCLTDCQAKSKECDEQNKNTFNEVLCKGKVTACQSICPLSCAGQALAQNLQQALGQALSGVTAAAGQ
ncbi:uncharacterized protein LOC106012667 [Aplysia californica]|uniref:Uncharacterized protein LOC106012667 n=1 Tax=Aplysia californica TaxID=6500 RepID=A0ABM1A6H2_APLCA|nr:uncharacterized protein LOC106012667 [Aplysia californica]